VTLVKTATEAYFTKVGDILHYTYVIINTGDVNLGPEQFTVTDDKINGGAAFNCGAAYTTLTPNTGTIFAPSNGSFVTCTATYTVTLADLDAGKVVNTARGHGYFGPTPVDSASASVTVTLKPLQTIAAETATPYQSIGGTTAKPWHPVTPPPTSSSNDSSGDSSTPLFALLICLAFGGLGLLAVQTQRRNLRR
jgi:hypothetical protein